MRHEVARMVAGKGLFVVFEGLDGAGTTTQTRMLATRLAAELPNLVTVASAEPSTGPVGSVVRQILRRRIRGIDCFGHDAGFDPASLALLFAADRLDHYANEILPVIEAGGIAISDRYKMSSLAYQGLDMPYEWVVKINELAPEPDLLFYLDVSPAVAWERVSRNRVSREIFEIPEILCRVHDGYRKAMAEMADSMLVILPGEAPIDEIADMVWSEIGKRLPVG